MPRSTNTRRSGSLQSRHRASKGAAACAGSRLRFGSITSVRSGRESEAARRAPVPFGENCKRSRLFSRNRVSRDVGPPDMYAGSVRMSLLRCPSCGGSRRTSFYSQERVPVHSCLLLPTREEAERFPRGTIRLAFCEDCGCIWNTEFDPTLTAYSPAYEDSQAFSPRFRTFADELAAELVERYDVHGKRVLEIGCGKGDFLLRLCGLGGNSGTGIDPAVDSVEGAESDAEGVTFIADVYSERYTGIPADLIVCRHTLEHLPNP